MENKERIQEVIVVEGKNDTAKLKQYFDCDTIETHGTCLSEWTLKFILKASKTRGVIVFTDPDSPGNRIRKEINEKVPGCKNAYIDKHVARTEVKVGIEHAGYEALKEALDHVVSYGEKEGAFTMQDMYAFGLSGRNASSLLREEVGRVLHLGNGNARTMVRRLNASGITKEQLQEVLQKCQK